MMRTFCLLLALVGACVQAAKDFDPKDFGLEDRDLMVLQQGNGGKSNAICKMMSKEQWENFWSPEFNYGQTIEQWMRQYYTCLDEEAGLGSLKSDVFTERCYAAADVTAWLAFITNPTCTGYSDCASSTGVCFFYKGYTSCDPNNDPAIPAADKAKLKPRCGDPKPGNGNGCIGGC